jgi:hypothetical protein
MHVNNKPGYKRSDWYYKAARIEYRRDNVFSETDNAKHERRRKQMAPGYDGCLFLLSDSLPTYSYRHRLLTGDCYKVFGEGEYPP